MTSRERVLNSISRKEVDMVPIDFGGTVVTSIDYGAHERLKKYMGISGGRDAIIDYTMGTVQPREEICKAFGSDVRRVGMNVIEPEIQNGVFTNGFGMRFRKAKQHEYYDLIHNPLEYADAEQLAQMLLPDPDDSRLFYGVRDRAKDLFENSPYAVFADFGVPGFFETSQKLRGYEQLGCDLLLNKGFLKVLYDKLLDLQTKFFRNYLREVNGYAQVIGYADDLGMQDRLQMSCETYRNVIKPYHKKIFSYIHEISDVKIMLHCCGAIGDLIDDLIEAGVDIINPMQTRATGMEPAGLKERFGGRVCFWGGIDEQYLIPFGTTEEVRAEVKQMLHIMGKGGYVLAPAHNIQSDAKLENLVTMFETAKEYRI